MNDLPFSPGDILDAVSGFAIARKIRVTAIDARSLTADVIEGEFTKDPITVYAGGWSMYQKQPEPASDFTPDDLAAVTDFAVLNAMQATAPNIVKEIRDLIAKGRTREQILLIFCELNMSAEMMRNCAHALDAIRRQAREADDSFQ